MEYKTVQEYYRTRESLFGYPLVLGGAKHFGLYTPHMHMFAFRRALRNMEDALGESLDLPSDSLVLDAGSGMGAVAERLVRKFDLRICGIDVLDFNVEAATSKAKRLSLDGRMNFRLMDYSDQAFESSKFDGAYTMETLVHAPDHLIALREFWRVLRPGGVLVNIEYSRDPDTVMSPSARRAFKVVNAYASMPTFDKLVHGQLEHDLSSCGFAVERVLDVSEQIRPMLRAFSLLAAIPYFFLKRFKNPAKIVNMMSAVKFWKYRVHFRFKIYISRKPLEQTD